MQRYLIRFLALAILVILIPYIVALFVRAPIEAEYWVREMIVIKRDAALRIHAPKIVFLGGSYTLFGIDAEKVANDLHVPAVNFGLHGGMRLEWLLNQANDVARS